MNECISVVIQLTDDVSRTLPRRTAAENRSAYSCTAEGVSSFPGTAYLDNGEYEEKLCIHVLNECWVSVAVDDADGGDVEPVGLL